MFKKILGTGATRILNLLIGFANMMLGAKILGAAEWGTECFDIFLLLGHPDAAIVAEALAHEGEL